MKARKFSRKRIIAFILSFLLVMQQSFALQVLASQITDANGNNIQGNNGVWNIRPDAWNGDVGFKHFDQINLTQGDVLNFIYQWAQQNYTPGLDDTLKVTNGNINTFVNLVNQGVNIHGIVNALQSLNGGLKADGNLMFITPGGMVVGSTGVLNVGNLSVVTPTVETFDALKKAWNLPTSPTYRISLLNMM